MPRTIRGLEVRPDLKELHIETPLDIVELKAHLILPDLFTNTVAGDIPVLPAGVGHKITDNSRAADGGYNRTTYDLDKDDFRTRLYGAEETWDYIESMELSDRMPDPVPQAMNRMFVPEPSHEPSWKRIEVAEGIELLVREDIYRRRRQELEILLDRLGRWDREI